ncbi:MAG: hypothetical protein R3A80_04830 [Bdellovibrionota bacterium]
MKKILVLVFYFCELSLWALNTHDVSGLQSRVWTMPSNELPTHNWTFSLETYDNFPFEFEAKYESLCFDSKNGMPQIYYYPKATQVPHSIRSFSCCFVTNKDALVGSSGLVQISKIVLAPKKKSLRQQAIHFEVQYPRNLLKEMYCSEIVDDLDGLDMKKSHLPSLDEISSLLSIGFKLSPDPI